MNALTSTINKVTPSTDDLSQQIEALRADLTKLAATISNDVTEGIEDAGNRIGQTARDARASATNTVRANPLTAVGCAVVVGLLFGLIARTSLNAHGADAG